MKTWSIEVCSLPLHLWCCWPWCYSSGCGHNIFCMGMEGIDCMVFPWTNNFGEPVWWIWCECPMVRIRIKIFKCTGVQTCGNSTCICTERFLSFGSSGWSRVARQLSLHDRKIMFLFSGSDRQAQEKHLVIRAIHDHNLTFHQSRIVCLLRCGLTFGSQNLGWGQRKSDYTLLSFDKGHGQSTTISWHPTTSNQGLNFHEQHLISSDCMNNGWTSGTRAMTLHAKVRSAECWHSMEKEQSLTIVDIQYMWKTTHAA